MNAFKNFFWFCSGATIALLKKTPTEHSKYTGIGATVFFTGLFAIISGSYAVYFIFNDTEIITRILSSTLFGLVWGAMIFNLDRYIVSSMKKKGSFWNEIKLAMPRFILAGIIALVISKPLELQIFHTSIEYELEIMKQKEIKIQDSILTSRFDIENKIIEKQVKLLQQQIDSSISQRNNLDLEARKEADGSGGSGKRGAAVIYNLKKSDAVKAQIELDSISSKNIPLIAFKQKELDNKRRKIDSLKTSVKRGEYDGFDKRLDALGNVSEKSKTISTASLFIILLFVAIEISPVLVKLLSSRGPYDDLLEIHEYEFEITKNEKKAKLKFYSDQRLEKLKS